jgi:F-type H+-transporting ATPase subunit delta
MIAAKTLVARRYATALFGAARKAERLDEVDADLRALSDTLRDDSRFARFLEAPHLLTEEKLDLIERAFVDRVEPLVVSFLKLLVRKRRMFALEDAADEFHDLVDEAHGLVEAVVTSAVPLTDEETERLIRELAEKTGKTISLITRVVPRALGGVKVVMKDTVFDGTLRYFLNRLRDRMMSVRVH